MEEEILYFSTVEILFESLVYIATASKMHLSYLRGIFVSYYFEAVYPYPPSFQKLCGRQEPFVELVSTISTPREMIVNCTHPRNICSCGGTQSCS